MPKPATVSVIYPRKDGATFDLDYYLATHMPLVQKHWNPLGLKGYKITQYSEGPHTIMCTMDWESVDAFQSASKLEQSAVVINDIANFSNEKPIIVTGEVVGTS